MRRVKSQLNFFLDLKKKQYVKEFVKNFEVNGKDICDHAEKNDEIKIFFEEAFKCHDGKLLTNFSNILNYIDLSCPTNERKNFCEIELREKELCNALKSMPNNKTLGNDGLTKEIYETSWNELKDLLLESFYQPKICKELQSLPHKGKL